MGLRLLGTAAANCGGVFLASLLMSSGMAGAAPLSLDDCLRIAAERNPRLVSAGRGVEGARQRLRETSVLRRPAASLHGGAAYAPVTGLDPALTNGGEYAGLLEIRQTLWDGGAIGLARRQADVGLRQATSDMHRTAADLRLDVRLAYADLVGTSRRRAYVRESIHDLESYLETVCSLANAGAVPRTDILKVELQLQSETASLEDLSAAVDGAMQRLLENVGLPADTSIAVQDSVALPVPPGRFEPRANRDLEAATLRVESAALETRLAEAERFPVVSFVGSLGGWTSRTQLLGADSPHVLGFEAGVALDVPVWNWGATSARIGQKVAAHEALRADYEALRRHLEAGYAANAARQRSAARILALLKESRTKAQEQHDLVLARYAGGGASSLEVLDAHRTLLGIALEEVQAELDFESLRAEMLHLIGEPQ